jgi:hypothetical protein
MTVESKLSAPKRRTRAEVQKLVAEFVSSGMRRSEFCRSRGLSFGTLNRHLQKERWKRKSRAASAAARLVPVELAAKKLPRQHEPGCGLAVVMPGEKVLSLIVRVVWAVTLHQHFAAAAFASLFHEALRRRRKQFYDSLDAPLQATGEGVVRFRFTLTTRF